VTSASATRIPSKDATQAGYDLTHKNLEHAREIPANAREFSKISEHKYKVLLAKLGLDALKPWGSKLANAPSSAVIGSF
jgi:hypothetical protein